MSTATKVKITITGLDGSRFSLSETLTVTGPLIETAGVLHGTCRESIRNAVVAAIEAQQANDARLDAETERLLAEEADMAAHQEHLAYLTEQARTTPMDLGYGYGLSGCARAPGNAHLCAPSLI